MKRQTIALLFMIMLILLSGCGSDEPTASPTTEVAPTAVPAESETADESPSGEVALKVIGPGGAKTFTMEELEALPAVEGWGGTMSSTGRIVPPMRLKGVTLETLADQVGGLTPDTGLNVVAKDGYAMTFSHEQITQGAFNTYDPGSGEEIEVDDDLQIIVTYERDGAPIPADKDGPLRLFIIGDQQTHVVDGHWAVKWVTEISIKDLAEDWTLQMAGAVSEEIDRATFESCAAPNCHQVTWTDEKAQEWKGVPLWLLAGRIDDDNKHGDNAYLEDKAKAGYTVEVIAADGYSAAFDSARINHNDDIMVAYVVNENMLPEDYFPLRIVGSAVEKSEMVGQIAQIASDVSPAAATEPTSPPEPTPVPATENVDSDVTLSIIGAVETEQTLPLGTIMSMPMVDIELEHAKKGMQNYQGVRLNALLGLAGIKPEATQLVLTASDGYQVSVDLADVQACTNCLVTFDSDSLRLVMAGMESSLWVKDIATIEAQ